MRRKCQLLFKKINWCFLRVLQYASEQHQGVQWFSVVFYGILCQRHFSNVSFKIWMEGVNPLVFPMALISCDLLLHYIGPLLVSDPGKKRWYRDPNLGLSCPNQPWNNTGSQKHTEWIQVTSHGGLNQQNKRGKRDESRFDHQKRCTEDHGQNLGRSGSEVRQVAGNWQVMAEIWCHFWAEPGSHIRLLQDSA